MAYRLFAVLVLVLSTWAWALAYPRTVVVEEFTNTV
jgi:hypothetical protein